MSLFKEAIQVLRHLPDTARHCPGQKVGIRQEEGLPVVGIIEHVSYREETLTAPAKKTTFIF